VSLQLAKIQRGEGFAATVWNFVIWRNVTDNEQASGDGVTGPPTDRKSGTLCGREARGACWRGIETDFK
jgi:hypothetical protein